jgi:hypothetical protein
MAALSDFSADDIISSDDVSVDPNITIAGPGTASVLGGQVPADSPAQRMSAEDVANQIPEELPLDSAAIERMLSARAPKEPVEAAEAAPEELEEPKAEEKGKDGKRRPSQERIVRLIAERNQARAETARVAAQVAEVQRQMASQTAEFQKSLLDLERRRTDAFERARQEQEEAGLSEVEKARRKFRNDTKADAIKELSPELAALRERVEAFEAKEKQAEEAAIQAQRNEHFRTQAQAVLDRYLLNGFTPEEQKTLGSGMEEMLYTFSGTFGVDPVRAAPVFKQFLSSYVKAENARLSRVSGTKVAASRQAPKPVPAARPGGTPAVKWPTMAQLHKGDGKRTFDNHVQWMGAGAPTLLA